MKKNSRPHQSRSLWEWDIVKVVTFVSILIYSSIFFFQGFQEESTRQVIRLTARTSAVLFTMAFGASALHHWQKNSFTWWLRMNRKFFGISFAIIHVIHLAFLLLLQLYFHPVFEMAAVSSLLSGGLAYLFVVLLLLTSFPFFGKRLSARSWRVLHTVGGYWIWLIFMISYLKRVRTELDYLPLVVLFFIVLLLRIRKLFEGRN